MRYLYATRKLDSLKDPARVAEILNSKKKDDRSSLALLQGVLGSIEKGGNTVKVDDSKVGQARHYLNIFRDVEKQKLGEKDYRKISQLVADFLSGPRG